ncbi:MULTISPECIES: HAD-IA family hydrolase [unclassified Oceanispirochaeta]|uniref:HAD-IA family hydrolase n=1 Tax=unclassified Oceanispirochaeta TaxID=2635722 RepID=UPI000E09A144|nr:MULTISPECIES: HAD-IA family hydrolase [unclassified Oceanispirochaeta]MBF9018054.1 HAD-IA family hydrolase [Oceanispirochaeta sp. M2]NPD73865.1 HAD-IA family hydrolase [Oceanispirochaeta sp. M1]RDG30326.1 HAD family hydrolase [Oceanispirochaeta sp. M1]
MNYINADIKTILFDVDNTLYDVRCGVEDEMVRRITKLVSQRLGVSEEEAVRQRKASFSQYGTSLRWLQVCHGLTDVDSYMEIVHPEDLKSFIPANPELRKMLESIPCRLEILTNGPEFHARRVLSTLGINDLFPHMYALEWLGFKGKPYASAYEKVLAHMDESAESVLFLDDKEQNLEAFARLGGNAILVGPDKGSGKFPWIRDILDLKDMLPACCGEAQEAIK